MYWRKIIAGKRLAGNLEVEKTGNPFVGFEWQAGVETYSLPTLINCQRPIEAELTFVLAP